MPIIRRPMINMSRDTDGAVSFHHGGDGFVRGGAVISVMLTVPGTSRPGRQLRALIDTGAYETFIRASVAAELALVSLREYTVGSVTHSNVPTTRFSAVHLELERLGFGIEIEPVAANGDIGGDFEIILGRDALRYLLVIIDGPAGVLTVAV